MAKKRTQRQTLRTTGSRNGGQVYVRGGNRNERLATASGVANRLTTPQPGRGVIRGSGRAAGEAYVSVSGQRRGPTTSPRPRRRPTRTTRTRAR